MIGVIVSVVPTDWYWIVCTSPVPTIAADCDTCTNGTFCPTFSTACLLFCAMITGSESTFTSPRVCSALIATA